MRSDINKIYELGKKLFPICRSITGNGVRQSLSLIKEHLKRLKVKEIKSGTKVFDWNIPPEWNIKEAYVADSRGKKIIDFQNNNLHLVNYSIPIKKKISKKELFDHLHFLKAQPNAIPYVTSYYKRYWGFCISYNDKKKIEKKYKKVSNRKKSFTININSSLNKKGSLTYGELVLPGTSKKEILISSYICHPSMANNELSGPLVSTHLATKYLKNKNFFTLRFVFIPETIGSIAYISKNLPHLKKNVFAGFNLTCIGDNKNYSFLPTKYGNTISDKAARKAFKDLKIKYNSYSFLDRGSDERQYNSPGVDLPVASIMRSKYGTYKEYHTSLDDFKLVSPEGLEGGYKVVSEAIFIIMNNYYPKNKIICEPNLGKRGLYSLVSSGKIKKSIKDLMNFLQYADGKNDLIDISNIIKIPFRETLKICIQLKEKKLIS